MKWKVLLGTDKSTLGVSKGLGISQVQDDGKDRLKIGDLCIGMALWIAQFIICGIHAPKRFILIHENSLVV